MDASIDPVPSTASSTGQTSSGQSGLAALNGRRKSISRSLKPNNSSTNSIASSDARRDSTSGLDSSLDGTLDKLKSRSSEEGQRRGSGETRKKMSKLFKGRRRRRKSSSQDGHSQIDQDEDIPPLPDTSLLKMDQPSPSEESLGMHKSVASSLVTEDSDAET